MQSLPVEIDNSEVFTRCRALINEASRMYTTEFSIIVSIYVWKLPYWRKLHPYTPSTRRFGAYLYMKDDARTPKDRCKNIYLATISWWSPYFADWRTHKEPSRRCLPKSAHFYGVCTDYFKYSFYSCWRSQSINRYITDMLAKVKVKKSRRAQQRRRRTLK